VKVLLNTMVIREYGRGGYGLINSDVSACHQNYCGICLVVPEVKVGRHQ